MPVPPGLPQNWVGHGPGMPVRQGAGAGAVRRRARTNRKERKKRKKAHQPTCGIGKGREKRHEGHERLTFGYTTCGATGLFSCHTTHAAKHPQAFERQHLPRTARGWWPAPRWAPGLTRVRG